MQNLQSSISRLTCASERQLFVRSCPECVAFQTLSNGCSGCCENVLAEMGIRSELRHNPAGLVRKARIATAAVGGIVALRNRRRRY
jgi:hypothetical protein